MIILNGRQRNSMNAQIWGIRNTQIMVATVHHVTSGVELDKICCRLIFVRWSVQIFFVTRVHRYNMHHATFCHATFCNTALLVWQLTSLHAHVTFQKTVHYAQTDIAVLYKYTGCSVFVFLVNTRAIVFVFLWKASVLNVLLQTHILQLINRSYGQCH